MIIDDFRQRGSHRNNATAYPNLDVGGIQPKNRPLTFERSVQERSHSSIEFSAQPGILAELDAAQSMDCTRRSTLRVEIAGTQVSWMTEVNAASESRRGVRKEGK